MEYFALIFNRSFLVFITDMGLQGWKFSGPVTARVPSFCEPIEELLDDPDMTPGSDAFNDLMHEGGTFVIPFARFHPSASSGRRSGAWVQFRTLAN
jgi:hypothetical protein